MFLFPILNTPLPAADAAAEQQQTSPAPASGSTDQAPPPGSDMELLRLPDAQLYLVDSQESVLMQQGEFRLVLTRQLHSPLAAVLALVKDVEWPVGEDCPVLRLHRCGFVFCLPRVTYGLLLPDSTSNQAIGQLEFYLGHYSTYEDRRAAGDRSRNWSCDEQAALAYWNNVAAVIGPSGATSTSSSSASSRKTAASAGEISPRMMKRVQQARRLSAVSKLFSRALLKGRISNAKHVIANSNSSLTARHRAAKHKEAVASVDAFAKVVEAVEHSKSSLPQRSQLDPAKPSSDNSSKSTTECPSVGNAWTLNELGLQLLIAAITASTVLHFSPPKQVSVPARATPGGVPLPGTTKLSGCGFRPVIPQHRPQAL